MINSELDPLLSKAGMNNSGEEDLLLRRQQAPGMAMPFEIDLSQITNTLRDEIKQAQEPQQQQINELVKIVNMLVHRPNANMAPPPVENNVSETGPNVIKLTPPAEDTISIAGSNRWFGSVDLGDKSYPSTETSTITKSNQQSSSHGGNGSTKSGKSPSKASDTEEPSQMYWNEATDDYVATNQATGPEITSSIAGAAKIFWSRPLKQESLKKKLEQAVIPSNCEFLMSKKVNSEIWTKMGTFNRSTDFKLQHAQSIHSAATTKMLRAASTLTGLFKEKMPKEIKEALTELKDSMTLAGNVSQQLNQVRRDFIKPTLPREYKKLASEADETSELLFGSGLCEKLEKLKKENNLCALLSTKRKFEEPKTSIPLQRPRRGHTGKEMWNTRRTSRKNITKTRRNTQTRSTNRTRNTAPRRINKNTGKKN